ncbi:GPO family capsid scaffolding protein [Spartinivicinus ruber]|uniref:GPO family capsid scaffolding protein n=1 Tax=Spartinivicinus ruber TaxID=2683272 RepID=UPI0013D2EC81|nr:GPO family capsid scaffolding protein [Spartinivicinus ruber]
MKSGPTVDGRTIEAQAILDMAAAYNPAEYTALLWYEHFRFYGNFGQVVELKTEVDDQDRQCLFAKIKPNKRLYELNEQQQQLFFSGEILPNFANTGKAYLLGLAITDQPASVGTSQLHFSHRRQSADSYFSQPIQWCVDDMSEQPGLFSRWFSKPKDTQEQGNPMDKEQFNQMLENQQKQTEAITQLTTTLAKLHTSSEEEGDNKNTPADNNPPADKNTPPENNTDNTTGVSAEDFNGLKTAIEHLSQQFTELSQQAVPGTQTPAGEGPADEHIEVL